MNSKITLNSEQGTAVLIPDPCTFVSMKDVDLRCIFVMTTKDTGDPQVSDRTLERFVSIDKLSPELRETVRLELGFTPKDEIRSLHGGEAAEEFEATQEKG